MKEKEWNEIKKAIETKKELPEEYQKSLRKKIFKEIIIAICVLIYFFFLNLGALNIEKGVFYKDLKVFSISLLAVAILLFEYSYSKQKGEFAIYGIECLIIAFATLLSIHYFSIYTNFDIILFIIAFLFSIYYAIKAILLYVKGVKDYSIQNIVKLIQN